MNISLLLDEIQDLKLEKEIAPIELRAGLQQEIQAKLSKVENMLAEKERKLKNSISTAEEKELLDLERRFTKLSGAEVVVDITEVRSDPQPAEKLNEGELIQLHERIMEQQDQQLDSLAELIQKQKRIGEQIHEELEYQVDLLEDVDQRVDRTMDRLNSSTRRINNFMESSSDSKEKPLLVSYTRQGQIPHLVSSTQKYRILPVEHWLSFPFDISLAKYCSFEPGMKTILTTHDINRQKRLPTSSTSKGFAFVANSGNQIIEEPLKVVELVSKLKPDAIILADPAVSIYSEDKVKSATQDRKLHNRWIKWLHELMAIEADKWLCVTGTTPAAIMHSTKHIYEEFNERIKVYGIILPLENDASEVARKQFKDNFDSFMENSTDFAKPLMVMGLSNFEFMVYALGKGIDIIDDSWLEPLICSGKAINLSFTNGTVDIIDLNPIGTRSTRITPKDEFKSSKEVLSEGCRCKTCTAGHTKAYLHHLLCVNDMCAFVLLAQHNYFVFDKFINEIKLGINTGSFQEDSKKWLNC